MCLALADPPTTIQTNIKVMLTSTMDSKVPGLATVSTDSRSASSFEDVFDSERKKKELDAVLRKMEIEEEESAKKQQNPNGIKEFISSIGDRVMSFYDSSFLAVEPPKSWNPNKDLSASVLSNPLFMCTWMDDKVCGYDDDRVMQREPKQPQAAHHNAGAQVAFHEGTDIPDVRRTLAYAKSTDELMNEICKTTIANARKEFLTREGLEDAIARSVEAAEAGNEQADEELRRLFPLRFVLPTVDDMKEMIEALQAKKTDAMRQVNLVEANKLQTEMDELQYQVDKEETYIRKREMSLTECVACEQKFSIHEVNPGEMLHCKECRQIFSNDGPSATFTLTQRPLESLLSIKVVKKEKGSTPLIPDLVDL